MVLGMWLPFNLGIPFLPPQELLGHLPIFGAMYLLLAHGPGVLCDWRQLMFCKNRPRAALAPAGDGQFDPYFGTSGFNLRRWLSSLVRAARPRLPVPVGEWLPEPRTPQLR